MIDYFTLSKDELLYQKVLLSKERIKHARIITDIETELVGIEEALRNNISNFKKPEEE